MPKKKEINILHAVLTLFVFLAPVFGSVWEKSTVIYSVLALFGICVGYRIYKTGRIVLTKSFLFLTAVSLYAFVQLIWVSDKGAQTALGAMFLALAASSLLIADYKKQTGIDNLTNTAIRLIYSASLLYSVMAILYQVFIESRFWSSPMSFSSGSGTTSAIIATTGIAAAIKLFGKLKKQPAFYLAVPVMVYVLIMSKSFTGYLFAALVLFVWAMTRKHKKTEAFGAFALCVALGVVNAINIVAGLLMNSEAFNGAIKGVTSVFGIGSGGYNAANEIVEKGYNAFPATFSFMLEAFGVIGLAVMVVGVGAGLICCMREKRLANMLMLIFTLSVIFSSSATIVFTLPVIVMYYTCREEGVVFELNKALSLVVVVPVAVSLLFTAAHIPYSMGKHQCDIGNYEKGGRLYTVGAYMEVFNSEGWEKAYNAYMKQNEAGEGTASYGIMKELILEAERFNKKNYKYKRDLAEVYTMQGDYIKALEIWDDIMIRYDDEVLYPAYAEKIVNVMAKCPIGLERTEQLYMLIDAYAKKATDKLIVFEMNNILAKSQQYYVAAREGEKIAGDMYIETEDVIEVEYESSSAEG